MTAHPPVVAGSVVPGSVVPGTAVSGSVTARVEEAYRRIAEVDRPEVWITLRPLAESRALAEDLDRRVRSGEPLPLAGLLVGVKDNIDVAGLPTTAASPSFSHVPSTTAPTVSRLEEAGALVLGKTNLDQFATGLVGTRSPYGAVRNAHRPDRVSGGSSSGSAVAVALGLVDIGLGTDTAGSGRVPAAFNEIVGIKPTLGLLPATGVVPAARPFDTVSIFARDLATAVTALGVMAGPDPADPLGRTWPADVRRAGPPQPRIAIPDATGLSPLSDAERAVFVGVVEKLVAHGAVVTEIDISVLLASAKLLYDGALVAERYAAVGEFLSGHLEDADPSVATIILGAEAVPAHRLATDQRKLDQAKAAALLLLAGQDSLLLPTTVGHPTLAEVAADPIGVNSRLGTYTNFVNLLDLAAIAVPAGLADGLPFGISFVTRAFEDQIAVDLAAQLVGETVAFEPDGGIDLLVFGAHLRGLPFNPQLVALGARYRSTVLTAPDYRMVALPLEPPRPGILITPAGSGHRLTGERWTLSPAALGAFLAALPAPMSLGRVRLDDGTDAVGFLCDPVAAVDAPDISEFGGWVAYLGSR